MQVEYETRRDNLTEYVNKKLVIAKSISQVNATYTRLTSGDIERDIEGKR